VSDSDALRETLREMLPDLLRDALAPQANGNGHAPEVVPQVPAPPVAAVLRPSTWSAPPAPGEVVGDADTLGENPDQVRKISQRAAGEPVAIDSDADLNAFVQQLAARLEDPGERRAIRSGEVRFTLQRSAQAVGARTVRIDKGAVTERIVRQAAADGARLVLARGAVLTPLARDQARALKVEIEKEQTC
jgi:hypothetical protein